MEYNEVGVRLVVQDNNNNSCTTKQQEQRGPTVMNVRRPAGIKMQVQRFQLEMDGSKWF